MRQRPWQSRVSNSARVEVWHGINPLSGAKLFIPEFACNCSGRLPPAASRTSIKVSRVPPALVGGSFSSLCRSESYSGLISVPDECPLDAGSMIGPSLTEKLGFADSPPVLRETRGMTWPLLVARKTLRIDAATKRKGFLERLWPSACLGFVGRSAQAIAACFGPVGLNTHPIFPWRTSGIVRLQIEQHNSETAGPIPRKLRESDSWNFKWRCQWAG